MVGILITLRKSEPERGETARAFTSWPSSIKPPRVPSQQHKNPPQACPHTHSTVQFQDKDLPVPQNGAPIIDRLAAIPITPCLLNSTKAAEFNAQLSTFSCDTRSELLSLSPQTGMGSQHQMCNMERKHVQGG